MQNLKRIIFISCFLLSNYVISGACDDYPFSHGGIGIYETEEEIKISATAHAAIHSDGVVGALEIAEEKAKRFLIAYFIQEICSSMDKKICDNISTDVLLRGVTKVDMCVQDNQHPRLVAVTVRISSSK